MKCSPLRDVECSQVKRYFAEQLLRRDDLAPYLRVSSVVSVGNDPELVYDIYCFIPDDLYTHDFSQIHGRCFVVSDQTHSPPVFSRFKDYNWLRTDLSQRVAIALWIFKRAIVIQDPDDSFACIIAERDAFFHQSLEDIARRKYIEFRTDRHNLRQAIFHKETMAVGLLKSNVVKLGLEILMLANELPYPYRKWLPSEVTSVPEGPEFLEVCSAFLTESDADRVIQLSDALVARIITVLERTSNLDSPFLHEWWLHLD